MAGPRRLPGADPWAGDRPPYAFGPGHAQPWIPQPLDWEALTVEAQEKAEDGDSTLAFYRRALAARASTPWSGDTSRCSPPTVTCSPCGVAD